MNDKANNPSTRQHQRQRPCSGLTQTANEGVKKCTYCAIYTRKSTTEGVDQDFTSLDAQREAGENYIASQKSQSWLQLPERYDDFGFTGANLDRPGLKKLLSHIKENKIDCVVVYKVDRLSRSLMDFAQLLEFFDRNGVTFVSVTQHFNTNTSMGRLTLNILLSFAQFEREIISERTKDKLSAARKRGQWTGGFIPLGYRLEEKDKKKKLIIEPAGAKLVKEIFNLYLNGNSTLKISQILSERGLRTTQVTCKNGRVIGGVRYNVAKIHWILRYVGYMGKVKYNDKIYNGEHEAIIDEETFKKTQALIDENHRERKVTKNADCTGLLSRLLRCRACATFMVHTYTIKHGTHKYRYYSCTNLQKHGHNSCPTRSVNSKAIEDAVVACLREIFSNRQRRNQHAYKQEVNALLSPVWDTLRPQEQRRIIKILVKEVDYTASTKKLGITPSDNGVRIEFEVNLKQVRTLNKWHKEKEIEKEPQVRKMLILAYQIQQLVNEGRIKHPREACKWLNLSATRIDQTMNTLFLCPAIQNDILSSDTPAIDSLTEFKIRPLLKEANWDKQLSRWKALIANNR